MVWLSWNRLLFHLFFSNDTATTEIYTLSLHDALPISFVRHRADKLQRQTGLPRSAGSGKRDQPNGLIRKPLTEYFHVSFAADQNGQRHGERSAGQLGDGRTGGRCPCARKQ